MDNSFYNPAEIKKLGLKSFGRNVLISKKASFYQPNEIEIGDNVRIDDFCVLSGKIKIGNSIHISACCVLYGKYKIILEDYSGLSARVTIYSATDDFSGDFAVGPLLPDRIRNVISGKVIINKYVQVGAGSIIMPGIVIGEGAAIGAMSLVNKDIPAWKIAAGIPAKIIKERRNQLVAKILSV